MANITFISYILNAVVIYLGEIVFYGDILFKSKNGLSTNFKKMGAGRMRMIFEENIMGRIIKVKVADDVLVDIKTKYFVNLKYWMLVDRLFHESFGDPSILHEIHYFDPYERKTLEEKKLLDLMREKGIV
jgi:hypothetical protein